MSRLIHRDTDSPSAAGSAVQPDDLPAERRDEVQIDRGGHAGVNDEAYYHDTGSGLWAI